MKTYTATSSDGLVIETNRKDENYKFATFMIFDGYKTKEKTSCNLCPWKCRIENEKTQFCGLSRELKNANKAKPNCPKKNWHLEIVEVA